MSSHLRVELPQPPARAELRACSPESLVSARRDELLEAALATGRAEGERMALEGPARVLEQAAEELAGALDEIRAQCTRQALELALGIARQIVRAELAAGHHDIERIVREALAHSGVGRGACVVHLNPIDLERLRHVVFRAGTRLEPDEDVSPGSVHVTTPKGLLVREVEACLDALGERLRGEL